jgi:hypothetical protein
VESQEVPEALRVRAQEFAASTRETGAEGVSGLIAEGQALADVIAGTVVSWDRLYSDD